MRWLALILVLIAFPAAAQDHDTYHQTYKNWRDGQGASCCNDQDCRPATVRFLSYCREGNCREWWQVKIGSRWCDIPQAKVRPYKSPDRGPHVCAPVPIQPDRPCHLYCYVHGEVRG